MQIWDSYGRNIYASDAFDHAITCIRWSVDGTMFAVGSYNSIAVCDRSGVRK